MKRFIEGESRQQMTLLPQVLEDYIDEDNAVRVIDVFVDELDLGLLGFVRETPASTGRPGYHPGVLLKIYLYGYLNRIQSSRRLERETQRNLELMWLTGRLAPDFKTIADFRHENGSAIRNTCKRFVLMCRELNLFGQAVVAIDGSKFKAVNNRDRNFTAHKLAQRIRQIEEGIERYLNTLDTMDRTQPAEAEVKTKDLKGKLARLRAQMRYLRGIDQRLKREPDAQLSLTDADARSMATSGRGTGIVGYNVQLAVDIKHHLIVAHDVVNLGHDRTQLSSMALQSKATLGADALQVIADRGYFKGPEILACEQAGIVTYVPKTMTSDNKAQGLYDKRDFVYLDKEDAYRCPAGKMLTYRHSSIEDGLTIRSYYNNRACSGCSRKAKCTNSAQERRIRRWQHEAVLDAMQRRIDRNPGTMRKRRNTVEHVFGTLKFWMGSAHFLTKTIEHVRTEIGLHALAYNLKRMMQILGVQPLIQAMQR